MRVLTIFILTTIFYQSTFAQNEYFANNPKWGIDHPCQLAPFAPVWGKKTTYYTNGDTLLNGELFVKIFEEGIQYYNLGTSGYSEEAYVNPLALAYLRSEGMKMFQWVEISATKELLYDFDVAVGELFQVHQQIFSNPLEVLAIDTIELGGMPRKVITVALGNGEPCSFDYIEGVGHYRGIWQGNTMQLDCQTYLTCYTVNNSSYFVNENVFPWLDFSDQPCEFTVGVEGAETNNEISLYPNPSNSEITISYNGHKIISAEIFDACGQIIQTQSGNGNTITLNVKALANGHYAVKMQLENNQIIMHRFIKE
jgi:hypothetical protein